MAMIEALNQIGSLADAITVNVPKIVAACAVLSSLWRKPERDGWQSTLHRWVNWLGFNVGHAANKHG